MTTQQLRISLIFSEFRVISSCITSIWNLLWVDLSDDDQELDLGPMDVMPDYDFDSAEEFENYVMRNEV